MHDLIAVVQLAAALSASTASISPRHPHLTRLRASRCPLLAEASGSFASVVIACGDSFDERLAWLCSLQGVGGSPLLRVEEIGPADAPSYVRIAGAGTSLVLTRDGPAAPLVLRLPSLVPQPDTAEMPIGCRAQPMALDQCDFVDRALPPPLAPLESLFDAAAPSEVIISRASGESSQWGVGRAGMLYRDLVPSRAGGALIASHIRIPGGGPVPDYVHFHRVHFQLIVCLAGWVEVVYEGQGHPFMLRRGDFVTQPPMIRHRVLSSSEGLEVLEVGAPATHATLADHEHLLPMTSPSAADDVDGATLADATANQLPNTTLYGGQRFVHSIYEEAMRAPATRFEDGVAWRESCVRAATKGLVRVERGAALSIGKGAVLGAEGAAGRAQDGAVLEGFAPPPDGSLARGGSGLAHDDAHLTIAFVTQGGATLACLGDSNEIRLDRLERADCATLPAGRPARWLKPTADFEVITVAFLKSEAAREAAARAAALEEVMQTWTSGDEKP